MLHIRSFEFGVLFTPRDFGEGVVFRPSQFSERRPDTPCKIIADWSNQSLLTSVTRWLPIPYDLPLARYGAGDEMWVWDRAYAKPDIRGLTFAGVFGEE